MSQGDSFICLTQYDNSRNATLPPGARLVVENDSARITLNPDKKQWSHPKD